MFQQGNDLWYTVKPVCKNYLALKSFDVSADTDDYYYETDRAD